MIGAYVECDGCGFRLLGQSGYPENWTQIVDTAGTQYFCARTCALATIANGGEKLERASYPLGLRSSEVGLLRLLAYGKTNKELARSQNIAESTVKNTLSSAFAKLGVLDRTQALLAAQALGLLNVVQLAEEFYRDYPGGHWSRTRAGVA